ncbi:MAG: PaaI family thioesterase [bacterium]|nr:PaaI family thioesterase [bacterium]
MPDTTPSPDAAAALNADPCGWDRAVGLRYREATRERVVAEYEVTPAHHQPYGIVHGGVHCSVVESVCSTGAGLDAMARGLLVVGVENHTSFLRAVRAGRVRVTATPLTRGRKTQLWQAEIHDADGRLAATGRVRLICLEPGSPLGGEAAGAKAGGTRRRD